MNRKVLSAIALLLLFGVTCAFAGKPTAEEQEKASEAMKALIDSRDYTVRVSQAMPLQGASVAVTSGILKINGKSVYSSLPYRGGGYASFSNIEGMRFTGIISDYQVRQGKKNKWEVTFKATASSGRVYQIKMEVFYNGTALISTSCANLDPMRYDGKIGPSEQAEQEAN